MRREARPKNPTSSTRKYSRLRRSGASATVRPRHLRRSTAAGLEEDRGLPPRTGRLGIAIFPGSHISSLRRERLGRIRTRSSRSALAAACSHEEGGTPGPHEQFQLPAVLFLACRVDPRMLHASSFRRASRSRTMADTVRRSAAKTSPWTSTPRHHPDTRHSCAWNDGGLRIARSCRDWRIFLVLRSPLYRVASRHDPPHRGGLQDNGSWSSPAPFCTMDEDKDGILRTTGRWVSFATLGFAFRPDRSNRLFDLTRRLLGLSPLTTRSASSSAKPRRH